MPWIEAGTPKTRIADSMRGLEEGVIEVEVNDDGPGVPTSFLLPPQASSTCLECRSTPGS
ncbi:MAG TPA: hypothetical protein VMU41_04205 [Candidatus Binataceae bacterium]|nr:hypothetical protein [Candidatus Binataceae bacterium]